jgi:mono/diheme cytochrome c family protein
MGLARWQSSCVDIQGQMRPGLIEAGVLFTLLGAMASSPAAGSDPAGRKLYLKYCGACHGPDAKGDGIVASFMRVKPADLTQIAARHGGEFPLAEVVKTIDGREMLHAHGEPAMPVWGQVLSEELGGGPKPRVPVERRIQGRILSISEYLQSIQAK